MSIRSAAEFTAFAALALALHAATFGLTPSVEMAGAQASGDSGEDLLTLQAAPETFAEMVKRFDAPPPLPKTEIKFEPPETRFAVTETVSPPPPESETVEPKPKPKPNLPEPKPEPKKPQPKKPERAGKPAKQKSPGATGQRAAGAGGGTRAGDGGQAAAATQSKAQTQSALTSWGATIRARVERRKSYPASAGRARGTVVVALTVSRGGQLMTVGVAKSSGVVALDQAAVVAVKRAGSFPAAPQGLANSSYSFNLPVNFSR